MTATDKARALLTEGRKHDEAMTDGPWEANELPPGWAIVEITTPSSVMDVPRRDAAGIAWMRTSLPDLLTGYAAALDEVSAIDKERIELKLSLHEYSTAFNAIGATLFPGRPSVTLEEILTAVSEVESLRAIERRLHDLVAVLEGQPSDWPPVPREQLAAVLRARVLTPDTARACVPTSPPPR